jgi:hypothetical protein
MNYEWFDRAKDLFLSGEFLGAPPPGRKTVFISHRKSDRKKAENAAKILRNRQRDPVDVWLDVEDPTLIAFSKNPNPNDVVEMLVTALVIEMALLNSTHVLALSNAL